MAKPFFRETRAVQPRTVFSGAPCLKLSVDSYTAHELKLLFFNGFAALSPALSLASQAMLVPQGKGVFPDSKQVLKRVGGHGGHIMSFSSQILPRDGR